MVKVGGSVARFLSFFACFNATLIFAQTNAAGDHASSDYDILGLKLGMTAQEAEAAIQQHLGMTPGPSPDAYRINSTPRRYQATGTFVDEFVISNPKLELIVDFAEVFPGKGAGSESLYWVSYTPRRISPDDRDDFVSRVLARFGRPTFVLNQVQDFWADRPYRSAKEALRAGVPVLELDVSIPKLILSDESIRQKMEKAFVETKKIPL